MDFEYCGNGVLIYLLMHHQIGWPPRFENPTINRVINNVKLAVATGLLAVNVVYHPEQALSLRYGPFIFAPAVQIITGFIGNNVTEAAKVKDK